MMRITLKNQKELKLITDYLQRVGCTCEINSNIHKSIIVTITDDQIIESPNLHEESQSIYYNNNNNNNNNMRSHQIRLPSPLHLLPPPLHLPPPIFRRQREYQINQPFVLMIDPKTMYIILISIFLFLSWNFLCR